MSPAFRRNPIGTSTALLALCTGKTHLWTSSSAEFDDWWWGANTILLGTLTNKEWYALCLVKLKYGTHGINVIKCTVCPVKCTYIVVCFCFVLRFFLFFALSCHVFIPMPVKESARKWINSVHTRTNSASGSYSLVCTVAYWSEKCGLIHLSRMNYPFSRP